MLLLVLGVLLIGGALSIRSSPWLREYLHRAKDLPELERAVSQAPGDAIARYHLAKRYYTSRRFGDALREYEEVVRLEPRSARAYLGMGLSHYELGHARDSRQAFNLALERDPKSAWTHYMLGKLAWQNRDLELAATHTRRATELDPRSDQAWYGLAACMSKLRRTPEAISALEQAVARNPQNAAAHAALGELLISRSEPERGVTHLERALELNPRHIAAQVVLGTHLAKNSTDAASMERAENLLRGAIKLKGPRMANNHLELGRLLARKGSYRDALNHFESARSLMPTDERAYYSLADALRRLGRPEEAEKHDRRFREISGRHIRMQQLEAKLNHSPENAEARLELARTYRELGMLSNAATQFSRYLDSRPGDQVARAEAEKLISPAESDTSSREFSFSPLPSQQ